MRHYMVLLVCLLLTPSTVQGVSTCSATNENRSQHCSISCPEGQAAVCIDALGSGTPECYCNAALDQLRAVPRVKTAPPSTDPANCVVLSLRPTVPYALVNTCNRCQIATFWNYYENKTYRIAPLGSQDIYEPGALLGDDDC